MTSRPVTRVVIRSPVKRALRPLGDALEPALRLGARLLTGPATPPDTWRRGLILGHSHLGDVLYRTASLPALAHGLPRCEWHYLAAPASAELLRGNPHLTAVHPVAPEGGSWTIPAAHRRALRALRFDVALCTNEVRYYPDLWLALRLGIPNRVGFTHRGLGGVVTHAAPWTGPKPWAANVRDLVAAVAGTPPTWELRPQVFPDVEDEAAAAAAWTALALPPGRPVVACSLTKRQPGATWPRARWVALLRRLEEDGIGSVVLLGAAGDAPLLTGVAGEVGIPSRVLAGTLGVRAVVAFLRGCSAWVGVDSGPRHLAAAAGIPSVFFRLLATGAAEAGPLTTREHDLAPPGLQHLSDRETEAALAGIDEGDVAEAVARVIAGTHR